ncbi:hypothetical protein TPY_0749 [Sulfobacillus acidophilus TPY]|nr:hypothetical protein TPY_0749 [Sulfobacillus acidophilus TPY]
MPVATPHDHLRCLIWRPPFSTILAIIGNFADGITPRGGVSFS